MKDNRIVVCFLDHSNDFSGGQKSLLALLSVLDKRRFRPVLILDHHAHKMISEAKKLDVDVTTVAYANKRMIEYLLVFIPVFQILAEMRTLRCDLLHCNTFKSGFIGAMISFFSRAPVIFRARLGIIHLSHGLIDKIIFHRSDLVLANSHYVKETFTRRFGLSEKVKPIYNPMAKEWHLNKETIEKFRSRYFADSSFYFGVIGRIEPFKKLEDVIEAARVLRQTRRDFKIIFIGSNSKLEGDQYALSLRSLIDGYGMTDMFEFTGFVSEIHEITLLLGCLLICSEGEALSRGVYESQSLGIPVIASDSGGNPELIIHEKTGLLYQVGNAKDLAEKMGIMAGNAGLRSSITVEAKALVSKLFSPDNTVEKEMTEYERLLRRS